MSHFNVREFDQQPMTKLFDSFAKAKEWKNKVFIDEEDDDVNWSQFHADVLDHYNLETFDFIKNNDRFNANGWNVAISGSAVEKACLAARESKKLPQFYEKLNETLDLAQKLYVYEGEKIQQCEILKDKLPEYANNLKPFIFESSNSFESVSKNILFSEDRFATLSAKKNDNPQENFNDKLSLDQVYSFLMSEKEKSQSWQNDFLTEMRGMRQDSKSARVNNEALLEQLRSDSRWTRAGFFASIVGLGLSGAVAAWAVSENSKHSDQTEDLTALAKGLAEGQATLEKTVAKFSAEISAGIVSNKALIVSNKALIESTSKATEETRLLVTGTNKIVLDNQILLKQVLSGNQKTQEILDRLVESEKSEK